MCNRKGIQAAGFTLNILEKTEDHKFNHKQPRTIVSLSNGFINIETAFKFSMPMKLDYVYHAQGKINKNNETCHIDCITWYISSIYEEDNKLLPRNE